jgi:hypothetical protein
MQCGVRFGSVLGNPCTISRLALVTMRADNCKLLRYQLLASVGEAAVRGISAEEAASGRTHRAGRTCRWVAVGFASQPNVPRDLHHIGETGIAFWGKPFREER